jgi:8-hydroxy-5-deazaflavin:NADPH oxidoreductase
MKITVLGTGMVGRALAVRLAEVRHDVVVGTRDVQQTLARTQPDASGSEPYATWQQSHPDVRLAAFPEAGAQAEVIVNATHGAASLDALKAVGADNLAGKVLFDLAVPLDLSQGMPPRLTIAHTDSLGEQIQREFPAARVVKSLNTVFKDVMVDPARVPGEHTLFVAGNEPEAKDTVKEILGQFGWPAERIIDLGDITAARSTEMYMQLYFNLADRLGTFDFNVALARA